MPTMYRFVRPDQLVVGETYYLRETCAYDPMPKYVEVVFIDYDSCPAYVYTMDGKGIVGRYARTDMFQKMIVG